MSERNTRADIHDKVAQICTTFGANIEVEFHSPDGKSIGQIVDSITGNPLSHTLPIGQLTEWLDGFVKGLAHLKK